ncbi:MAG: hypothetical protein ABI540_10810 [Spartobacteria bacterium]
MKKLLLLLAVLVLVAPFPALSQTPASTPTPTPACQAVEFRQFDFWLGKWKVTDPKGQQVGTSEISRQSEGCAIREQWSSGAGKGGMSINYYDPIEKEWHQDWVGGDGTILHLRGGLKEGAMVLRGEIAGARGSVLNRITWTSLPGGKVRQEWATSTDDGQTWAIAFVGTYEKQN